jgi:hypothetical protein
MGSMKNKLSQKVGWPRRKEVRSVSTENWYIKAAVACESTSDALLRRKQGATSRATKLLAGKLGAVGTSVGIFALASFIGVASTGTAIGTLSGAAFTSAALAWLGGSVFIGSIVLAMASFVGGVGAAIGVGWLLKKYLTGMKRKIEELSLKEKNIIDACLSLAVAFRQKHKEGQCLDPYSSKFLCQDALRPLCEDLSDVISDTLKIPKDWPPVAKGRLEKAVMEMKSLTRFLMTWTAKNPNLSVGISTAVFLKLLSEDLPNFDRQEQLVIDSIKRSTNELSDNASTEEVSEYIKSKTPSELVGIRNNVKGIYHELAFVDSENSDGDEYFAELFQSTNHPGADVRITNTLTGETTEIQLKATNYLSYVEEHNNKYSEIVALATEEVASKSENIESSGLSNEELTRDVEGVVDDLEGSIQFGVASSMTVAAMVTLARNVRVLLRGKKMTKDQKEGLIEDGLVAAGVAGIVSLFI